MELGFYHLGWGYVAEIRIWTAGECKWIVYRFKQEKKVFCLKDLFKVCNEKCREFIESAYCTFYWELFPETVSFAWIFCSLNSSTSTLWPIFTQWNFQSLLQDRPLVILLQCCSKLNMHGCIVGWLVTPPTSKRWQRHNYGVKREILSLFVK